MSACIVIASPHLPVIASEARGLMPSTSPPRLLRHCCASQRHKEGRLLRPEILRYAQEDLQSHEGDRGEEHERSRDDSFCRNGYFFGSSADPFSYVRRLPPEDSVVKVRTIRFVGLAFIIASREGWRTDAQRQFLKGSRQQFSGICDRLCPTRNFQNTILRVIWRLL